MSELIHPVIESEMRKTVSHNYARHQKWGGTYLVVADESEDFEIALHYAAQMANANKCRVGILHAIQQEDFMHWGNIEARLETEKRNKAEKILSRACIQLEGYNASTPCLYLEHGGPIECITHALEKDDSISMLILCASTHGSGPGPLVSYFTSKGLARLQVPVLVVPDHIGKM